MNRKQRIARVLLMTLALIGTGTAHAMGSAIFIVAGAMMGSTLMFSGVHGAIRAEGWPQTRRPRRRGTKSGQPATGDERKSSLGCSAIHAIACSLSDRAGAPKRGAPRQ